MTKYLAQSSRLATFVMAAVGPVWLGWVSPNLQGDPDFDLLTNYPNSKFKYSNTKQLFTVLNPEREKQRTLYKIYNFLKYKEILHLFHHLKYQFDDVTTENKFKAPNKLH